MLYEEPTTAVGLFALSSAGGCASLALVAVAAACVATPHSEPDPSITVRLFALSSLIVVVVVVVMGSIALVVELAATPIVAERVAVSTTVALIIIAPDPPTPTPSSLRGETTPWRTSEGGLNPAEEAVGKSFLGDGDLLFREIFRGGGTSGLDGGGRGMEKAWWRWEEIAGAVESTMPPLENSPEDVGWSWGCCCDRRVPRVTGSLAVAEEAAGL
jgi:hypothetical protein